MENTLKPFDRPVFAKYGAPMGRHSDSVDSFQGPVEIYRVPMHDGGYDKGGAYWGYGLIKLYCVIDANDNTLYRRAWTMRELVATLPSTWTYTPATKGKIKKGY